MKLEYTKPELEIEIFEVEDVITLSNGDTYDVNDLDDANNDYNSVFGN